MYEVFATAIKAGFSAVWINEFRLLNCDIVSLEVVFQEELALVVCPACQCCASTSSNIVVLF